MDADEHDEHDDHRRGSGVSDRIGLYALAMAALTIMGWAGDALAPALVGDAPLVLIALNPRMRNLVLVTPDVGAGAFFAVAIGRQLLADPLFFAFGRRYGDSALRWTERHMGPAAWPVLLIERAFARAALPLIAVAPNNLVCLLAGASTTGWAGFLAANVAGTVARVIVIRLTGDAFAGQIGAVTDWMTQHRLGLTAVSIVAVGILAVRAARTGRGEIETPQRLEEELDEPELA